MEFSYTPPNNQTPLEQFGRNLNQLVLNNKLDPVIGRNKEIRRLIEILSRKTKNNPILIGDPGVGKTAIVEGFVQRIIAKDVPNNLLDKVVYELSLSNLIAGASFQGEFEKRIKAIIKQVEESCGQIILFIDEIHQLIGAGRTQGAMDAANILKPIMARGDFKIIGATTLDEYSQYIEKDGALERRLHKIVVDEPSVQESYTILRGLKSRWEIFHGVKITDSAIVAAVDLSHRYITDRKLPDKAIDLIDEAAAKVKTTMSCEPKILDDYNREIINLETEKAALNQEDSSKNQAAIAQIDQKLQQLKQQQRTMTEQWEQEKSLQKQLIDNKNQILQTEHEITQLQQSAQFEKASKLLYLKLPELQTQNQQLQNQLNQATLVKDKVELDEITNLIAEAYKIPVHKLLVDEKTKLLNLKQEFQNHIIGQDQALELLANAVMRSRVGLQDPDKPIGSFLFLGPTGVGKTEVAKVLANYLFNSEQDLIRIDMSEYLDKHAITKLIGVAPGFVGYERNGLLTEQVRNKPYSVILFDEIEKAHSDVLNLLLQILDYGKIRDGKGRDINFKNTIIIMSSNVCGPAILANKPQPELDQILHTHFRPEFLNRFDEIVYFHPINPNMATKIVTKFLHKLQERLVAQQYQLDFDDSVINYITQHAFDERFGARALKRFVQSHIENWVTKWILEQKLLSNQHMRVVYDSKAQRLELKSTKN